MAERVLVTGGAGFIGLHLVRRLLREGARVTVLDDFSRGADDAELRAVADEVELVRHDLTTPMPGDLGHFDAVYHLAGVVGVQRVTDRPAHALRTNVLATLSLLDWCAHAGPGMLFLSSTSEIGDGAATVGLSGFPVPEGVPFVLAEPRASRASYALSKVTAEFLFAHACPESRVRIVRYHNIYGPRMGMNHVVPQFIERVLARADPFPLYGAYQSRAFCHIDDAVEGTMRLTKLTDAEPVVANIGNDREEIQIIELARRLCALGGRRPEFAVFDPPPESPARRLPDLHELRRLTGYEPVVDLATGLGLTFDWYAAQGSGR